MLCGSLHSFLVSSGIAAFNLTASRFPLGLALGIAVLVVICLLFKYDEPIYYWVQRKRNHRTDRLAKMVKPFGDGRYTLPPLVLLYLYGYLAHDGLARHTVWLCLASFLATGFVVQSLQYLSRRHRPDDELPNSWDGPKWSSCYRSFPSGHASASFSVLTVLALQYAFTGYVPVIALGLALLTALSRLNDHAHWPSDVFIGVSIGFGLATMAVMYIR